MISWDYTLALYGIFCNRIIECKQTLGVWRRHNNAASLYTKTESKTSALKKHISIPSKTNSNQQYLFVLKCLAKGNTHTLLPNYIESRINFLNMLFHKNIVTISPKDLNRIIHILKRIQRQTPLSIIIAGIFNIMLYSSFEQPQKKGIVYTIKRYLFAFKYPGIFWFESIDTPWLC